MATPVPAPVAPRRGLGDELMRSVVGPLNQAVIGDFRSFDNPISTARQRQETDTTKRESEFTSRLEGLSPDERTMFLYLATAVSEGRNFEQTAQELQGSLSKDARNNYGKAYKLAYDRYQAEQDDMEQSGANAAQDIESVLGKNINGIYIQKNPKTGAPHFVKRGKTGDDIVIDRLLSTTGRASKGFARAGNIPLDDGKFRALGKATIDAVTGPVLSTANALTSVLGAGTQNIAAAGEFLGKAAVDKTLGTDFSTREQLFQPRDIFAEIKEGQASQGQLLKVNPEWFGESASDQDVASAINLGLGVPGAALPIGAARKFVDKNRTVSESSIGTAKREGIASTAADALESAIPLTSPDVASTAYRKAAPLGGRSPALDEMWKPEETPMGVTAKRPLITKLTGEEDDLGISDQSYQSVKNALAADREGTSSPLADEILNRVDLSSPGNKAKNEHIAVMNSMPPIQLDRADIIEQVVKPAIEDASVKAPALKTVAGGLIDRLRNAQSRMAALGEKEAKQYDDFEASLSDKGEKMRKSQSKLAQAMNEVDNELTTVRQRGKQFKEMQEQKGKFNKAAIVDKEAELKLRERRTYLLLREMGVSAADVKAALKAQNPDQLSAIATAAAQTNDGVDIKLQARILARLEALLSASATRNKANALVKAIDDDSKGVQRIYDIWERSEKNLDRKSARIQARQAELMSDIAALDDLETQLKTFESSATGKMEKVRSWGQDISDQMFGKLGEGEGQSITDLIQATENMPENLTLQDLNELITKWRQVEGGAHYRATQGGISAGSELAHQMVIRLRKVRDERVNAAIDEAYPTDPLAASTAKARYNKAQATYGTMVDFMGYLSKKGGANMAARKTAATETVGFDVATQRLLLQAMDNTDAGVEAAALLMNLWKQGVIPKSVNIPQILLVGQDLQRKGVGDGAYKIAGLSAKGFSKTAKNTREGQKEGYNKFSMSLKNNGDATKGSAWLALGVSKATAHTLYPIANFIATSALAGPFPAAVKTLYEAANFNPSMVRFWRRGLKSNSQQAEARLAAHGDFMQAALTGPEKITVRGKTYKIPPGLWASLGRLARGTQYTLDGQTQEGARTTDDLELGNVADFAKEAGKMERLLSGSPVEKATAMRDIVLGMIGELGTVFGDVVTKGAGQTFADIAEVDVRKYPDALALFEREGGRSNAPSTSPRDFGGLSDAFLLKMYKGGKSGSPVIDAYVERLESGSEPSESEKRKMLENDQLAVKTVVDGMKYVWKDPGIYESLSSDKSPEGGADLRSKAVLAYMLDTMWQTDNAPAVVKEVLSEYVAKLKANNLTVHPALIKLINTDNGQLGTAFAQSFGTERGSRFEGMSDEDMAAMWESILKFTAYKMVNRVNNGRDAALIKENGGSGITERYLKHSWD